MFRRVLSASVMLAVVAALTVLAPPASQAAGGPANGKRCHQPSKITYKVSGLTHSIKIGYAKTFTLAPGGSQRKTKRVRKDMTVSSMTKVNTGAELGAKGISKLLVKVEAYAHVQLEDFTKSYTRKTVTIVSTQRNTTNRNHQYVAYRATHEYRGRYTQFYCQQHPTQAYPTWVSRSKGKWRSHQPMQDGSLRCGAGTPGDIAEIVSRRHCGS